MQETLARNLDAVLERVRSACRRAGRPPEAARLCAVTKSVPPEVALALAGLGQRDLGENRLAGLEEKVAAFERAGVPARWHFIGHVQRNKARRVLRLSDVLHSVSSLRLAATLARVAAEEHLEREVFLQVKLSGEDEKHGLDRTEVAEAAELLAASPELSLVGLMTMAPRPDDPALVEKGARRVFGELASIGASLDPGLFAGRPLLSMGMSGDYEVAIEEGADWVRVGSALYEGLDPEVRARPPVRPEARG